MQSIILIDIDIKMSTILKYNLLEVLQKKIEWCNELLNVQVDEVNFTESQCGNLHLHIILQKEIDEVTAIRYKFCVGEDNKRLMHSIRRFEKTGDLLDFFWLVKNKKCKEE